MSAERVAEASASTAPMPGIAGRARAWLRLLRPRQWSKNGLLFAALVFARRATDLDALAQASLGFVAFCMLSGATYAMNDVLDVERDRAHPRKRLRPIASGAVSPRAGLATSLLLAISGLALCASVNAGLFASGVVYLSMTQLYSMKGKNVPILDILLIAAGFVVRAIAGALAIDVPSSSWFLNCTLFGAIFLALCKRRAELRALESGAAAHRPVLASYTPGLLQGLIAASMAASMMSYALYVFDVRARAGATFHPVELTLPCVVYGLFRYYWLVEVKGVGGSPELVLLTDRGVQLTGLVFLVIALLALYL